MGQQQLLLLVIGVVIVAFATVAALYVLQVNYQKDEADGLLNRSLAIATHAVYWKTKNDPFSGGNQSYEGLVEDGLEKLALDDSNVRGRFAIVGATKDRLRVAGVSDRFENVGVCVLVEKYAINRSFVRFDGSISLEEDCLSEDDE
jgi:hypothetical protein